MLFYLLVFLHIFVSISLVVVVLLQAGKGAEMGASFGSGGSQSVFGAGGGSTFMSKVTTSAAVIFMLTSLTLAYLSSHTGSSSIMKNAKAPAPTAPAKPVMPAPAAPAGQAVPAAPATAPAAPPAPATPR